MFTSQMRTVFTLFLWGSILCTYHIYMISNVYESIWNLAILGVREMKRKGRKLEWVEKKKKNEEDEREGDEE